jgi:hypothetical protein
VLTSEAQLSKVLAFLHPLFEGLAELAAHLCDLRLSGGVRLTQDGGVGQRLPLGTRPTPRHPG